MTRFFLRHPVSTWMIFTAFVVMGIYALPRLRIEAMPELSLPTLTVETVWPGASPPAVQRSITLPVEEAARKVFGVEDVESTSRAGQSVVEISFRRGTDVDFARLDLNEQMSAVRRSLPLGAWQPQIRAFVPEEFQTKSFFLVSFESPLTPNELREQTQTWIVPRVLGLDGVAEAEILGGANPLIKIMLDRTRLDLHGITADEVFLSLLQLDELAGAGIVQDAGEEKLVALREPVALERLQDAVIARRGDRNYTLGMLGEVKPGYEDPRDFVRSNGQTVVQMKVQKRSGSNAVTVSRNLRETLPEIVQAAPFPVIYHIEEDEGADLEDKLEELVFRSAFILVLLFALLAVTLRQVRLTAIVIGSVVFSVVISLSLFYFFRLSVNFITISGLTISFGMILDNGILVLEAIHRRLHALERATEAGLARAAKARVVLQLIAEGTREVAFPIVATTCTTMVAFLSFIFLSGRLKIYYEPLAVAVATATAAAMFVGFAWIPVALHQGWASSLVRRMPDGHRDVEDPREIAGLVEERADLDSRPHGIERLLGWAQRLWWIIIPATTALLIWSGFIYKNKVIKGGFWKMPDPEILQMWLVMPEGTDVDVVSGTIAHFEQELLPVPEGARLRVWAYNNFAHLQVRFEDEILRSPTPAYYRMLLERVAGRTAGVSITITGFADQPYFSGQIAGAGVNSRIRISGYNSRRLQEIADRTLVEIERQRRVRNAHAVTTEGLRFTPPDETLITFDRERLAQHGLTVMEIVAQLSRLLDVDAPARMLVDGREEDVQLAFLDSERIEFSDLASAVISTSGGERIRVGDLVSIETAPLSGPISRENQRYSIFVNWEYVGTNRMRLAFLERTLAGLDLPYGFEAEEMEQTFITEEEEEQLTLTLVLSVVFIYMVMCAFFEGFMPPVTVLLSLPLALVGVVLIYWKTTTAFDSSARIGLVLLFGVAVNNAILLVSRFAEEARLILRAKLGAGAPPDRAGAVALGLLPRTERAGLLRLAIARATRVRLNSILLTSGTTFIGLLPLLLPLDKLRWLPVRITSDEGGDIWSNLALTNVGGLVSSTVLLILALPPLYYASIRLWWVIERWFWPAARWTVAALAALAFVVAGAVAAAGRMGWMQSLRESALVAKAIPYVGPARLAEDSLPSLSAGGPGAIALGSVMIVAAAFLLVPRFSKIAAALLALLMAAGAFSYLTDLAWPSVSVVVTFLALLVLAYTRPAAQAAPR